MSDLNNMNGQPDNDNPLGDVDPLAWLESLAARQGATEGFTRDYSGIDIPEIDPNSVVIDEPGYTPYETFGKDTSPVKTVQEPPAEPVQSFGQAQEQPIWGNFEQQAAQPEAMAIDPSTGIPEGVDPLAWLESLAARQGATEGFTRDYSGIEIAEIDPNSVVIDEPGYTPSEVFHREPAAAAPEPTFAPPASPMEAFAIQDDFSFESEAEPLQSFGQAQEPSAWGGFEQQAAQPEAMAIDPSTGIPEGVDPLAWLESLAARQGATEGFTRDYSGIEIAEIDPNSVVIDEPGYTPSEVFHREPAATPEPPASPMEAFAIQDDFSFETEAEPLQSFGQAQEQPIWDEPAQPQADAGSWFDMGAGELGETADFLDALSEDAAAIPNMDLGFGESPAESGADLSWLNELSGEKQTGSLDFLQQMDQPVQAEPLEEAIPPTHTPDQVAASIDGMSDEELAQGQATRSLTPEQELAWFQRQAMSRYQALHEAIEEPISYDDLPMAEAGEIPDWLRQSAVVSDEVDDSSIFVDELAIPSEPADMPDWLKTDASAASEMELPDFTLEAASGEMPQPSVLPTVDDNSFQGLLKLDEYDPSVDEWAEALDEEHERLAAGIEEDPTWFRTAKAEAQTGELSAPEPEPAVAEPTWLGSVQEEVPAAEIPDDLPEWLRPVAAAAASTGDTDDIDIGTWLRAEEAGISGAPQALSAATTPATGTREESAARLEVPPADSERLTPATGGPLPEWARAAAPPPVQRTAPPPPPAAPPVQRAAPPAAPRPVAPPPPPPRPVGQRAAAASGEPVPPASPPAPVPATFEQYKAKLEQNPADHRTRLDLAREIAQTGDVDNSVQQYQTLVEQMGELDSVSDDLRSLITTTPAHPALRRLLGDVYMRQGYLQEALDAYRGALDNL